MNDFGSAWSGAASLLLTAPPGTGWGAYIELSARKQDGRRLRWTEERSLSAETAVHTVAPPAQDDGAVTLLRARVSVVHADERTLRAPGLAGQFVVASDGVYASTEQRFSAFIVDGDLADPHVGMVIDEEEAP